MQDVKSRIIDICIKRDIKITDEDFRELQDSYILKLDVAIQECEDSINENFEHLDVLAIMGFYLSTYNSEVEDEVYNVINEINLGGFGSDIAKKIGLSSNHVELIQYSLCANNLADYGTSPRGCWLTPIGIALFDLMQTYTQMYKNSKVKNFEEI